MAHPYPEDQVPIPKDGSPSPSFPTLTSVLLCYAKLLSSLGLNLALPLTATESWAS